MSTTKLNEADLLKMGFSRSNVAALREAIDAIGNILSNTTLADLAEQIEFIQSPNFGPVNRRLDDLSGPVDVDPRIAVLNAKVADIDEVAFLVNDLRAKIKTLETRVKSLENVIA